MVAQRRASLCIAMVTIMLLAVQIPLLDQQVSAEVGTRSYNAANCQTASRPNGTSIYVDAINGSDYWNGTSACPKSSIGGAIQSALAHDEIIVRAGLYHENMTIDNLDGLTIRAATGERVVIDGTKSITEDFNETWHSDVDGIQYVDLPQHGWQLFLDHTEQIPARWPNANFEDESVFNRSRWAQGTLTNSNNAYTNGWLTDAGNTTGTQGGLLASGIDPVGAIAILNVASFRSYSREVTSWNASNETIGFDVTDLWKTKHHAYFLEGKRELIDIEGEWWYNDTAQRLHYKTPANQNANNLDLRIKTQPYAFNVINSDDVAFENLEFFATTVQFDDCVGCSIEDTIMRYPSTSKRGLNIAGEDVEDRWVTRFDHCSFSLIENSAILYTDGTAVEFHGAARQSHNNTINNSYFSHIDWSVSDTPGLMVTIYDGGKDNSFSNNTIHRTGASATISIGDAPTVMHNEVWDTGLLQSDGAVVQMMMNEQQDANIGYNWIHDTDKYGIRMDGPAGGTNEGRNATVHHNVLWNVSGAIMVKGDYHHAHNNTVLWDERSKNHIIVLHENGAGNENSTIWNNAADSIAAHRSDTWDSYPLQEGTFGFNWNGYRNGSAHTNVSSMLVDPDNLDFRPQAYSDLDLLGAGAYDAQDTNPWIPGVTWTYVEPSKPRAGCLDSSADNYDSNAVFSSGNCAYTLIVLGELELDVEANIDPDGNHVEIEVEFVNVTAQDEFEYEIWFTRVDPNYKHHNFTGEIEPDDGETTFRVLEEWTPMQDGPYTVHCSVWLSQNEVDWFIGNSTDTFGWGDVVNNSHPPIAGIGFSYAGEAEEYVHHEPDVLYLDIANNETRQENIEIEFDASDTERLGDYRLDFALYEYQESGIVRLIGMGVSSLHASYHLDSLNSSANWAEGNEYKFTLSVMLNWGNTTEVAYESLNFTIGTPPDTNIYGCTDVNATNYDPEATTDDGSCEFLDTDGDGVFDHLEIEGCTNPNATNFDSNATDDDGTCIFLDTDGDGVFDFLEIAGCTNQNATNFEANATDDDGTCTFLDTDGDGVYDYMEIRGCTNLTALNYEIAATDDDGSCVWPAIPLNATIEVSVTEGEAPLTVSLKANISGGQEPYQISWEFGDGIASNDPKLNHTFAAGTYTVTLRVSDSTTVVEDTKQIVATAPPVIENLTGYFSHSGQLISVTKGMFAAVEFTASASGGEGPYSFSWTFGDKSGDNGTTVLHEYANAGIYTVQLVIEDSAGRSLELTQNVTLEASSDDDETVVSPEPTEIEGGDSNFDIYATSTGVIGLLLIFGLFGRKRRESFLEAERRKMHGEGSIWDKN